MKSRKLSLLICFLFFAALQAQAHILLTTPYQVVGPTGVASASAPHATATSKSFDWITNTACITYSFGTATYSGSPSIDTGFTVLASAPTITNCLNLTTGVYTAGITNGPVLATGTLTGTNLTAAIATYSGPQTALRDAADYFAMGTFLPGTRPSEWGAGD